MGGPSAERVDGAYRKQCRVRRTVEGWAAPVRDAGAVSGGRWRRNRPARVSGGSQLDRAAHAAPRRSPRSAEGRQVDLKDRGGLSHFP